MYSMAAHPSKWSAGKSRGGVTPYGPNKDMVKWARCECNMGDWGIKYFRLLQTKKGVVIQEGILKKKVKDEDDEEEEDEEDENEEEGEGEDEDEEAVPPPPQPDHPTMCAPRACRM